MFRHAAQKAIFEMKKSKDIFFVDPQSLISYDTGLLSSVSMKDRILILAGNGYHIDIDTIPIFHYYKFSNNLVKGLSYFISIIKLFILVRKYNPRLIHIEWIRVFYIDLLFLYWLRWRGVKIVYTAHNILPHSDLKGKYFSQYKHYYSKVDYIFVHTIRSKYELVNRFGIQDSKIVSISHGIIKMDIDETIVSEQKSFFDNKWKLKGKIVFSSLGNQSEYKGFSLIKKMWMTNSWLRDNCDVCLIVAGKISEVDTSELDAIPNVYILGKHLSNNEFIALLRSTSVVLLPYLQISQSGVLLTAINETVPVVVSNVGGLTDPLDVGKIGWNIGVPTIDNLSDTIKTIIDNPSEILEIKNNTTLWTSVKNTFSWANSGKITSEVYRNCLK